IEGFFAPIIQAFAEADEVDLSSAIPRILSTLAKAAGDITSDSAIYVRSYVDYWIKNLDEGLKNYGDLNLALSKTLYDPQTTRDLQNQVADGYGADVAGAGADYFDKRAEKEGGVNLFDVLLREIDDPNHDGTTEESYFNKDLISMLGMPNKLGELRAGFVDFLAELDQMVLEPARGLAPPIMELVDKVIEFITKPIKDAIENFVRDQVREKFGIDIEVFEYLSDNADKVISLKSITLNPGTPEEQSYQLFKDGDREKLDGYLGFVGDDYFEVLDGAQLEAPITLGKDQYQITIQLEYQKDQFGNVRGDLKPNAEFDKDKFAAFANARMMSKLVLLQETVVRGVDDVRGGQDPKTISKLLSDLIGQPYDFAAMTLNGNHGGSLITAVMPGVVDEYGQPVSALAKYGLPLSADPWMSTIDSDAIWRANSETATSEQYRKNRATTSGEVEWTFAVDSGASYFVQADWLTNNSLMPAMGQYQLFDDLNPIGGPIVVDQSTFPSGTRPDGTDWVNGEDWGNLVLGLTPINVSSGILRIVFTATPGAVAEAVVVAGRVRIENAADQEDNRIVSYKTPAADLQQYGDTYNESPAVLFEVTNTLQVADMVAELEATVLADGRLPPNTVTEAVFANPGPGINPEPLIGGSDTKLAVVSELIPGQKWLISNVEPVNADTTNATAYTERYTVELINAGMADAKLVVSMDWQSIAYPTGNGNFPLWESATLRDSAFRQLFRDWINGDVAYQDWLDGQGSIANVPNNFPDFGDEPTTDPAGALGGPVPTGTFLAPEAYLTAPVLNASGTYELDYNGGQVDLANLALLGAGASFVEYNVDGQLKRDLILDQFAFTNIDQNAADTTVTIDGTNTAIIVDNIIIKGFLGSVGFDKLNIIAKESIVIEDSAMLSSRFISTVTSETDYVAAASEGNSGNIILKAPKIVIGDNASVLANADGAYNAGFIYMETVVMSGADAPVVQIGDGATLLATTGDGDYGTVAVETLTNPDPTGAPIELFEGDISIYAYKPVTQTWEFFGIDGFNWLSSEARIEVGADTDLSGNNIKINTKATTDKQAILDSVDFAGATTSLAYADLNADGYMDLIMGNHDQVDRLMLNDGTGKYLPGINISADKNDTTAVAAGDVNLDGLADIIVGNSGSGQLLLNDGGGFAAGNNPFVASTGLINLDGLNISAFALDDVDNDGDKDLVVGVNGGANLLYLNQGLNASDVWLGFASGAAIGGGEAQDTTSLALSDLDGDSDLDLVVGNYDQANRVYLFDSTSHSFLAGTDILSGETDNTTSIALGDVNNDGAKDVVFGNDLLVGGDRNRVFLGNGAGGFIVDAGDPAAGYIPSEYHHTKAVSLSDINNDGFDDLIEGNDGESTRVYLSDGVGGFTSGIDITAAAFPTSALALFDANNDGDKDLVVANNRGVNQLYEMGGTLAFDSQADVDALNNTINLGSSLHGLVDGDAVIFRTDGAALSTNGLSDKTTYYVDVVDADPALVRLFTSRAEALVGDTATAVVLTEDTATDSSSYRFEMAGITRTFNSVADVDAVNNTIHFATAQHGLTNGSVVLFRTGDASASAIGLNDKSAYYVGVDAVDPAYIRLFASHADALSGDTSLAVDLSADAGAGVEHKFQTIAFQPGVGLDVDQELVHSLNIDNDGVVLSTNKAVGVISESLAKIVIGHGADFNAVQDIYLQSHAISQTKVETYRSAFGVTYGNSSPTALVIVENGANLFAGGDFTMNALTNNELKVDTFVPSLGESTNIAFSVGWARSISEADLQSGATVKAANATIEAHNENSFENRAYAHGFGTAKDSESGFSATLALGFYQSEADATVSGNMEIGTPTTPGVLNIFAISENVKNITQTYSSVSGNPANQYIEDLRSQSRGTLAGTALD
ncbi:MAG: VCBS repeat-containing protein, partial [Gammaproteobacteria bacterium]